MFLCSFELFFSLLLLFVVDYFNDGLRYESNLFHQNEEIVNFDVTALLWVTHFNHHVHILFIQLVFEIEMLTRLPYILVRDRAIVIIIIKSKNFAHFILLIALINYLGHECDELFELEAAGAVLVYSLEHFNRLLLSEVNAERLQCVFQLTELNRIRLVPIK